MLPKITVPVFQNETANDLVAPEKDALLLGFDTRSEYSLVVLAGGLGVRNWPIVGYPMSWTSLSGRRKYSGTLLSSYRGEGNSLEIMLSRLDSIVPIVLVCREFQRNMIEAWKSDYLPRHPQGKISIVTEPNEGLGTGGALRLGLNEVDTKVALVMYNGYYNDVELLRKSFHYALDALRTNRQLQVEKQVGIALGLAAEKFYRRYNNLDFHSYFKLQKASAEGLSQIEKWHNETSEDLSRENGYLINPGLYIFDCERIKSLIDDVKPTLDTSFSLEKEVIPVAVERRLIQAFSARGLHWSDLGNPLDFSIHRFYNSSGNLVGRNCEGLNCKNCIITSNFSETTLVLESCDDVLVSLVAFPKGAILLVMPNKWLAKPYKVSDQLVKIDGSKDLFFTLSLDGVKNSLLDHEIRKNVDLGSTAPFTLLGRPIKVWSPLPIRVKTTRSTMHGRANWIVTVTVAKQ
jgi:hypothetical protein